MTPCGLVGVCQCFIETGRFRFEATGVQLRRYFSSDKVDGRCLRNADKCVPKCTVS